jgi:hypothetical protein
MSTVRILFELVIDYRSYVLLVHQQENVTLAPVENDPVITQLLPSTRSNPVTQDNLQVSIMIFD